MPEFIRYLSETKKWWIVSIIIILVAFGIFIVLAESTTVLPYIYTLF